MGTDARLSQSACFISALRDGTMLVSGNARHYWDPPATVRTQHLVPMGRTLLLAHEEGRSCSGRERTLHDAFDSDWVTLDRGRDRSSAIRANVHCRHVREAHTEGAEITR